MKAILVMDMPQSCDECPLEYDVEGNWKANICRGCGKQNNERTEKPEWCPLKEVPQYRNVVFDDKSMWAERRRGWNACIDEILGKEVPQYRNVMFDDKSMWAERRRGWNACGDEILGEGRLNE